MTAPELIKIANEYIEETISLRELSARHGMSKTTLIRYFSGQQLITLPIDLQMKVDAKKEKNWIDGKSTSGNLGHILATKEQIQDMAKIAVDNNLSLRELEKVVGVNYGTLHTLFTIDNLGIDLYQQVLNLYSENKPRKRKQP